MKRTAEERRAFVERRSAEMEANPTEAEARMWEILEPLGFTNQAIVWGQTKNGFEWYYILDFYRPDLKLAVEVDGSSHRKKKGRDRRRDERLKGEGIETLRVKNDAVLKSPSLVFDVITMVMDQRRAVDNHNAR